MGSSNSKKKIQYNKITAGPEFCEDVKNFFNDVKNQSWIFNFIKECNIGSDIFLKNINIGQDQVDAIIYGSLDYNLKISPKFDYLNFNTIKSLKLLLELLELLEKYNFFLKLSFSMVKGVLTDIEETRIPYVNKFLEENSDNINEKIQEIDDFKIYIKYTKKKKNRVKKKKIPKSEQKQFDKVKDQFDRVKVRSDKYIKNMENYINELKEMKERDKKEEEEYEKLKQIYEQTEDKNLLYIYNFPYIIFDFITDLYSELYILNMEILYFNY